jgi:hypothetical protein
MKISKITAVKSFITLDPGPCMELLNRGTFTQITSFDKTLLIKTFLIIINKSSITYVFLFTAISKVIYK